MRCEQFRELISAYIERGIASPLIEKMQEHAARCESCRTELEDLQALWQMMSRAPRVEPPASLHARIMREVYASVPATPAVRWWELAWRPRFAFAAAAVLAVIAFVLWPREMQTNAIVLSVVSSSGNPVSPLKSSMLPLRFEPFNSETGNRGWMLTISPAHPTTVEVTVGTRIVWSGVVAQQTPVVLPASPSSPVLVVRVQWDGNSVVRAWLPAQLAHAERKPVLVLKEQSIDATLAQIARAYGVPLALVGQTDPLTRVNLESTGVALDQMLQKLAEAVHLEVSRAQEGTIVLTAR
jgi:hypothetical protein